MYVNFDDVGISKADPKSTCFASTGGNGATNRAKINDIAQQENGCGLNIIDITGRTISSRNLGQLSEGSYQETIDCSGLANGIYFINIKNNTTNRTSKLIIHK